MNKDNLKIFNLVVQKGITYGKSKGKDRIFCKECGYETPKWMGQCPAVISGIQ